MSNLELFPSLNVLLFSHYCPHGRTAMADNPLEILNNSTRSEWFLLSSRVINFNLSSLSPYSKPLNPGTILVNLCCTLSSLFQSFTYCGDQADNI